MKLCPLFESIENEEVRADCRCHSCTGYFAGLEAANRVLPREAIEAAIEDMAYRLCGVENEISMDEQRGHPKGSLYSMHLLNESERLSKHIEQLRALLPKGE